jgi:hypothetical protein
MRVLRAGILSVRENLSSARYRLPRLRIIIGTFCQHFRRDYRHRKFCSGKQHHRRGVLSSWVWSVPPSIPPGFDARQAPRMPSDCVVAVTFRVSIALTVLSINGIGDWLAIISTLGSRTELRKGAVNKHTVLKNRTIDSTSAAAKNQNHNRHRDNRIKHRA